jgi:hypothetical protein
MSKILMQWFVALGLLGGSGLTQAQSWGDMLKGTVEKTQQMVQQATSKPDDSKAEAQPTSTETGTVNKQIPARFVSNWGNDAKICKAKGFAAMEQLQVRKDGYSGYELGCDLKKAINKGETAELVFNCSAAGDEWEETQVWAIEGKKLKVSGTGQNAKNPPAYYLKCGK